MHWQHGMPASKPAESERKHGSPDPLRHVTHGAIGVNHECAIDGSDITQSIELLLPPGTPQSLSSVLRLGIEPKHRVEESPIDMRRTREKRPLDKGDFCPGSGLLLESLVERIADSWVDDRIKVAAGSGI